MQPNSSDKRHPDSSVDDCRFSIRHHFVPTDSDRVDHWDLFLQNGDSLLSWEVQPFSEFQSGIKAIRRPDHRLLYLDFEGSLTGGRGQIVGIDSGPLQWETLSLTKIQVVIFGKIFRGSLILCPNPVSSNTKKTEQTNTSPKSASPEIEWTLDWKKDVSPSEIKEF